MSKDRWFFHLFMTCFESFRSFKYFSSCRFYIFLGSQFLSVLNLCVVTNSIICVSEEYWFFMLILNPGTLLNFVNSWGSMHTSELNAMLPGLGDTHKHTNRVTSICARRAWIWGVWKWKISWLVWMHPKKERMESSWVQRTDVESQ